MDWTNALEGAIASLGSPPCQTLITRLQKRNVLERLWPFQFQNRYKRHGPFPEQRGRIQERHLGFLYNWDYRVGKWCRQWFPCNHLEFDLHTWVPIKHVPSIMLSSERWSNFIRSMREAKSPVKSSAFYDMSPKKKPYFLMLRKSHESLIKTGLKDLHLLFMILKGVRSLPKTRTASERLASSIDCSNCRRSASKSPDFDCIIRNKNQERTKSDDSNWAFSALKRDTIAATSAPFEWDMSATESCASFKSLRNRAISSAYWLRSRSASFLNRSRSIRSSVISLVFALRDEWWTDSRAYLDLCTHAFHICFCLIRDLWSSILECFELRQQFHVLFT